jgi:hypothetical protein
VKHIGLRTKALLGATLSLGTLASIVGMVGTNAASASPTATTTVVTAASQTQNTLPANVTFTATVSATAFDNGGSVTFTDNGVAATCTETGTSTGSALAAGVSTCTIAYAAPGAGTNPLNHAIQATYGGDANFGASTSANYDEYLIGAYHSYTDPVSGTVRYYPNNVGIDRDSGSDTTVFMMGDISEQYTNAGLYGGALDATNGSFSDDDYGNATKPVCVNGLPVGCYTPQNPSTTSYADNYSRTEILNGIDSVGSGAGQDQLCGGSANGSSTHLLPYQLSVNNPKSTQMAPRLDFSRSSKPPAASATCDMKGLAYAQDEVTPNVWNSVNPGTTYHAYINCPALFGIGAHNTAGPGGVTLLCSHEGTINPAYYVAPNTPMPAGDVLIDSTTGETAAMQTSGADGAVAEGNVTQGWLPGDDPSCTSASCDGASLQSIDNAAQTAGSYGANYYENGDPAPAVPNSAVIPTPTENGDGINAVSYRLWCTNTPYTPGSWNAGTMVGTAANPGAIRDWGQLTDLYTGSNPNYGNPASDNVGYGANIGIPVNVIGVNSSSGTYATLQGFAGKSGSGAACGGLNVNAKSDEVAIENNAAQAGVLIAADCHKNDVALGLAGAQLAAADGACTASQLASSVYFMSNGVFNTNAFARTATITVGAVTKSYGVSQVNLNNNGTGPGIASVIDQTFPTFRLLYNIYRPSQVRLSTADFLNYLCDFNNPLHGQPALVAKGTDLNTGSNFDTEITQLVNGKYGFYRQSCDQLNGAGTPIAPAITSVADPNS